MLAWLAVLPLFRLPLAGSPPFQVPPGFSVTRVAAPPAVVFPMFAARDERGALYVAESSGLDLYEELQKQTRRCRVSRLEDRDGDGLYEHARVFADQLVFPMGLVWRDGKLYVADPPDLITLEDTDGDGRADRRSVLLTGFGHTSNGSLHGLIFGPDGWLYLTMGQPDGYQLQRRDGSTLSGKSGALLRCRPDGTDVEVVCRGFENLVEVEFLPSGEIIGTDNWFARPEAGERDALVHLVEGGLYPLQLRDEGTPFLVSGDPLPAIQMYPAVALSGMVLGRSGSWPEKFRGRLFTAQFNARKVVAHRLTRHGSTFQADDEDFLTTEDPDFHPSDVLEDADGSLLVVDTGAWYVHHCPTGRIRKAPAQGGLYRVRVAGTIGRASETPIAAAATAPTLRSLAATNSDEVVRAARAFGRTGDRVAEPALRDLLAHSAMHVRFAAAEALAHCGSSGSVPALFGALAGEMDPFLEHALIHALHRLASAPALTEALAHPHPRVQRVALTLLAQPPHRSVAPDAVIQRLFAGDEALSRTARRILQQHPAWDEHAIPLLRHLVNPSPAASAATESLPELILAFQTSRSVQAEVAAAVTNTALAVGRRMALLEAMARTTVVPWPAGWASALDHALREAEPPVRLLAARTVARQKIEALHETLLRMVEQTNLAPELRLEAIRATLGSRPRLSPAAFELLLEWIRPQAEPASRLAAAELLGRARWADAEKDPPRLITLVRGDRLLSVSTLLPLLVQAEGEEATTAFWSYLMEAVQRGWQPSEKELGLIGARGPRGGDRRFGELSRVVAQRAASHREQVDSHVELLSGGDPVRGARWFVEKAGCAACHRVGTQGGLIGPDLTKIGAVRSGRDLIESIVVPSATFAQGYDTFTVTLRDGEEVTGIRLRPPDDSFVIRTGGGAELNLRPEQIQSVNRSAVSLMPEGLLTALTREEIRDLFAYLQSLR